MEHFVDERGQIPPRLPRIALYLGKIVVAASPLALDVVHTIDVPCRRRPGHQRCAGHLLARHEPSTGTLLWQCPRCDDHGYISNWQGSPWDRSSASPSQSAEFGVAKRVASRSRAIEAWQRIEPGIRLRLLNNVWCASCSSGTSMALDSASVSGDDLVLQGRCTKCGGDVARVVEEACRT
jgi:hypothetical protein